MADTVTLQFILENTLNPSIDLTCKGKRPGAWHGWVQNGEVR